MSDVDMLELTRIDFDNLENRNPLSEESLGMFLGDAVLTAQGRVRDWLEQQPPVHLYLGWDGAVYPQFAVKRKQVIG